jgi:glycine/D-amino acid oxidase-like deaminating enzyme
LAHSLPDNVDLYDNSPVVHIGNKGGNIHLTCPQGEVVAQNLVIATNGFMHAMTPMPSHTIPLTLTASLTRPLNKVERAGLGDPQDWGVLSLHDMGATIRYTDDHRILIRNTVAYKPYVHHNVQEMRSAIQKHQDCLHQRFPLMDDVAFEHSWQGNLCISRNSTSLFGKLAPNIYASGCYNASGVSRGSALGYLLADYALGRDSDLLDDVLAYPAPKWMPGRPFLDVAMKAEIRRKKIHAGADG